MREWKTYKLSNLQLDVRNFRTGDTDGQREAIRAIILDQKGKLANLARDALNHGLSPGEPIWVTPNPADPGKAIVLEGNRRISALKLMENPELADGTEVEKAFKQLSKQFAESPIREVEALVFPTAKDAEPWIDRRHMSADSGIGLQPWKPIAKNRRSRQRGLKTDRFFAVHELLADHSEEWMRLDADLAEKWTTVDRVLIAKEMPRMLGVNFDGKTGGISFENGDRDAGKDLLRRVLTTIAEPNFKFSKIENKEDRELFLSQFAPHSVKKAAGGQRKAGDTTSGGSTDTTGGAKGQRGSTGGSGGRETSGQGRRPKADPLDRSTLAPKTGNVLHVFGKRLNPLYRECREIEVDAHKNAASFLLRVFLELSTEAYCIAKKVPRTQWMRDKGFKTWDQRGIRLDDKVAAALAHLDPAEKNKRLDQARLALDHNSPSSYSIGTLHGYFHNLDFVPDPREIKHAWDAWESYLLVLHDALNAP